ncbi:MAG TPA: MotA/TolQ/ExbB proton channel family protein [Stellaceae bacterium]|nr:MotA/TolQ/ExbB proton channel family protein [Stellaceae bacterium]
MTRFIVSLAFAASLCCAAPSAIAQTASQQSEAVPPAPAAPAAPAPSPPAASPTTEIVENPYGLSALWNGGDFVARGTLIALLIMSMGSWYVIITKLVEQTLIARQASSAERNFWRAPSIGEGAGKLGRRSAFRMMVEDGVRATDHREGLLAAQIDAPSWITLALQRSADSVANRLQRGLAFLATVGSTAPFVGLFGTVWGIYHALTAIGIAGQASIDKVAGPVGEALIMTAMGLAVAVPAVLGYNWLIRRNKVLLERVRNFAADLLALFTGAARRA